MLLVVGLVILAVVAVIVFQLRPNTDGTEKALLKKPLAAPVIAVVLTGTIAAGIIFTIMGISGMTG